MRSLAIFLALTLLVAFAASRDTLKLSPVQQLSIPYHFNVLTWEIANFPAKWLLLAGNLLHPYQEPPDRRLARVQEYFQLRQVAGSVQGELNRAVASGSSEAPALERRLRVLNRQIAGLRLQVEEALEAALASAMRQKGVGMNLGLLAFPPVDFSLDRLPTLLVTSPRDRIQRLQDLLLTPRITIPEREALEEHILSQQGLSALVTGIGGISTYPAIVVSDDLRGVLVVASHEWLHNYLFFRPLGQAYQKDGNMSSINETAANMFGEELGDLVYAHLSGKTVPQRTPGAAAEPCPEGQFCFGPEMRQTRLQVEQLLAQGKVEEAETYMEERRRTFVANGHPIRKLNQAYFAFHGTYADSPASISPVYQQLLEVRRASPSLGAFIHRIEKVSSYQEFTALLQQLGGT